MPQSGRTRIAITVVLVALIGAVGAFLLPVLVHETKAPVPTTFRAEVTFAVPAEGLPRGAPLRVTARLPGGQTLTTTEPLPANANGKAVTGMILDGIADAEWPEAARPQIVGESLAFPGVELIGGDPDRSGVPLSLSVSGRPDQALVLRISVSGGPRLEAESPAQISFSARSVVGDVEVEVVSAAQSVTHPFAFLALSELQQALEKEGWTTVWESGGTLLVSTLPDGAAIGSAILTVAYEGIQDPPFLWTIELVP